jgi:hypothetical protein
MTVAQAVFSSLSSIAIAAGLVIVSGLVAVLSGVVYRIYMGERVQSGLAILVSLAVVALYLNVKSALGEVAAGVTDPLALEAVIFNGGTLVAATLVVPVGVRVGDKIAMNLSVASGGVREADFSRLVRSVGRSITVTLPSDIETVEGYEPVADEVRTALEGKELVFPGGLTVNKLRDRVIERLREDHGIGYVDLEMDEDGTVPHLGIGSRPRGIGPTLGPGTAAVAVSGDPAYAASSGDAVQLWTTGETPERVASGELRGRVEDTVTLALDAHEAPAVAGKEYRIVTVPNTPKPEHEFRSILRAADETMGAVTVTEGGPLVGLPVGALRATVVAIAPEDGPIVVVPPRTRVLSDGDVLYLVAAPSLLRRIETTAPGSRTESS